MKKLLSLLVAFAMTAFMFAGCTKDPAQQPSKADLSTTKTVGTTAKTTESEPVTLKLWTPLDTKISATMKSLGEVEAVKEIQKATNVKLDIQHPSSQKADEQLNALNLLIAANDLPDIIVFNNYSKVQGGPDSLVKNKIILPLNSLIEKNSPNFKSIMDKNSEAKKQIVLENGSYYMYPTLRLNKGLRVTYGFQIRKDWLDKLNLQTPKNIDDWYKVLKAFKENDPNGNGKKDEIPFVGMENNNFGWGGVEAFSVAFGFTFAMTGSEFNLGADGKVRFPLLDQSFKDYLDTMAKWYKEGLIDKEWISTDAKSMDAKVTNDTAGAWIGTPIGNMSKYGTTLQGTNPKAEVAAVPWPATKSGKSYTFIDQYLKAFSGEGLTITTACKKPDEAARFADFLYSEKGHMLMNFGIENISYKVEDGYPKYTDLVMKNPDKLTLDQAMAKYTLANALGLPKNQDIRYFEQILSYAPAKEAVTKVWKDSGDIGLLLPPLSHTDEESKKIASVMAQVKTYSSEYFTKVLLGTDTTANFSKFTDDLKKMGIEDIVKIKQAALDRYNKK